jgi:hypothetical protein
MILTSGSFVNFKWWKAILNLRCQCQGGHSRILRRRENDQTIRICPSYCRHDDHLKNMIKQILRMNASY